MEVIKKLVPILVVDDDEDDRLLIERALRKNNILNPVFQLEDGKELMNYLGREGKFADPVFSPIPGIIFLDLNMPKIDGRIVLLLLKNSPVYKQIPVVILTTSKSHEDIVETYSRGANVYITKPNDFEGLLKVMETTKKYWLEIAELPSE